MSEEIKNEEQTIDEKLNELLNDPLIRTKEEKDFIQNIGESLKKGQIPIDLILNKTKDATSKLEDLKKVNPEFESFVNHYKNKINETMEEMKILLKDITLEK